MSTRVDKRCKPRYNKGVRKKEQPEKEPHMYTLTTPNDFYTTPTLEELRAQLIEEWMEYGFRFE